MATATATTCGTNDNCERVCKVAGRADGQCPSLLEVLVACESRGIDGFDLLSSSSRSARALAR